MLRGVQEIERIVGQEVGRGIQRLVKHASGNLLKAAKSLAEHPSPSVAICTGFYIPKGSAAETDGPIGAATLAAGLAANAIPVRLVTDKLCHGAVAAAAEAASSKLKQIEVCDLLDKQVLGFDDVTHFISIECPGPSKSGRIFNMSARDITEYTSALWRLYSDGPWIKIAIGDGGNEIGMGSVPRALIARDIQHGEQIACVTPCDYLIVAGVSNWGAWGLLAALTLLRPDWNLEPFLDPVFNKHILQSCVEKGPAVDGVTGKQACTVDGLEWSIHLSVLNQLLAVCDAIWKVAEELQSVFFEIDQLVDLNGRSVRKACRDQGLGPHHFAGSSGYGHGDLGRQTLDKIVAQTFGAEAALVRSQFVSGTHAITAGLFGVLRPGDELISITGSPYDTLQDVIGSTNNQDKSGSLHDWGVAYRQIELLKTGRVDLDALTKSLCPDLNQVVYLQRSCGYATRPTLKVAEIESVVAHVKRRCRSCLILVDNCYGEFTEEREPTHVGADLVMGSLIKNPGGTIAPTGGYVAGRQALLERVHARLTAPGIGMDAGSVSGETLRLMFQGFCLAPQMVGEALKSGLLISHVMHKAGCPVCPLPSNNIPSSFITAVELGSEAKMIQFCKAVQEMCPVGSYVQPTPGETAGYDDCVIFADGTFIDGSTSELSADGPIRPPYAVYCQGGTHWTQWAEVLENVLTTWPEGRLNASTDHNCAV